MPSTYDGFGMLDARVCRWRPRRIPVARPILGEGAAVLDVMTDSGAWLSSVLDE